jgi:trehalose 2-sulfotransferase
VAVAISDLCARGGGGKLGAVRWVVEPLPITDAPPPASRSLLLCCTPRCGSWLLADLLEQTGVAGRPHEWFWGDTVAANKRAWGIEDDAEYRAAVLAAGTTPNGVFSAKLMWTAFEDWRPLDVPSPQYVWLRRGDEVAQAVSFWKAVASGHWHSWDPPAGEARYDEAAIAHLLGELRAHNESWRAWFDANGVTPLDVRYEAVAADPDGEARRVLEFLGVDAPAERLVPRMRRVGDAENADWAARFRAVP